MKILSTRRVSLALFASYSLLCGFFLWRQDFPSAFIQCALAFFMLGQWLQQAMTARRDQAANDLIHGQRALIEAAKKYIETLERNKP